MELIIVLHASSSCQVIASLLNYPCPMYALDLRVHVFSVMQLKQHSWDLKLHTSSFKVFGCTQAHKQLLQAFTFEKKNVQRLQYIQLHLTAQAKQQAHAYFQQTIHTAEQ